jgi:hypothetical protein
MYFLKGEKSREGNREGNSGMGDLSGRLSSHSLGSCLSQNLTLRIRTEFSDLLGNVVRKQGRRLPFLLGGDLVIAVLAVVLCYPNPFDFDASTVQFIHPTAEFTTFVTDRAESWNSRARGVLYRVHHARLVTKRNCEVKW